MSQMFLFKSPSTQHSPSALPTAIHPPLLSAGGRYSREQQKHSRFIEFSPHQVSEWLSALSEVIYSVPSFVYYKEFAYSLPTNLHCILSHTYSMYVRKYTRKAITANQGLCPPNSLGIFSWTRSMPVSTHFWVWVCLRAYLNICAWWGGRIGHFKLLTDITTENI